MSVMLADDWLDKQTAAIHGLFRRTAEAAIECGLIIAEVKGRIEHGQYTSWVSNNLPFSMDTAERCVQAAAQFAPHGTWIPQLAEFDASALYLLSAPKTPQAARDMAIQLAVGGHQITYTAAKNILKQVKSEPAHREASPVGDKGLGTVLREMLAPIGSRLIFTTSADPEGDPVVTAEHGDESVTGRDIGDLLRALAAKTHKTEPGPFAIDPEPHIDWAKAIGAGVASDYDFGPKSQERSDLEAAAVAELTARCRAFQPERVPEGGDAGGLLRGYAHQSIQKECRREAERLRNGGTYHTRRQTGGIVVHGFTEEGASR